MRARISVGVGNPAARIAWSRAAGCRYPSAAAMRSLVKRFAEGRQAAMVSRVRLSTDFQVTASGRNQGA